MRDQAPQHRPRVIVCGATFGKFYLEALRRPDSPFDLVGLLASGADRSLACAAHYDIPLYRCVEEAPPADIACVVVRAGILGGMGTEIAKAFMRRGVNVLQEQPLHHDELADCLRTAHECGVYYRINPFHTHLEPTLRFTAIARALLAGQSPVYIDAVCGFQLTYSVFEILAGVLGRVWPWSLNALEPAAGAIPAAFVSVQGALGAAPLTLRVQNQLNPLDPDNFARLLYRISLGIEGGDLLLASSNGPILWTPQLHVPATMREDGGLEAMAWDGFGLPSVEPLGPFQAPSWGDSLRSLWPDAAARALEAFWTAASAGRSPLADAQGQLACCRLVKDLTALLGPPGLIEAPEPRVIDIHAIAGPRGEPLWEAHP